MQRLDSIFDPLQHGKEDIQMMGRLECGLLYICGRIWWWMIVVPRRLWFRVAIPSALPGLLLTNLDIVNCVVASDKPSNIHSSFAYCRRILCAV
ncbi:hypothetical protein SAMN04488556_3721 [Halostagnicola kamekurae]|uniref:Uncharacterized protein n=1 Tax=Halostagnicola kamekurae TaxID=619731 RepID=A0A1I6UBT5_9EURY|nr:hypothetical protein SAMN04488556_3721 [Halostagnicola kamekurae]